MNEKRKNRKFLNAKASIVVNGTDKKSDLKIDPFYREFEYGKNMIGYWKGNHTSVQLEDCTEFFCATFSKNQ